MNNFNPLVTTYASHFIPEVNRLALECKDKGWNFIVNGGDNNWRGFSQKLYNIINNINEWKKLYSHILFIDAFDVRVLGTPNELKELLIKYNDPDFVCSLELACWPNKTNESRHKESIYPWKYYHSQFILKSDRLDILQPELVTPISDDQEHIQNCALAYDKTHADNLCEFYQAAAHLNDTDKWFELKDNRVYNKITQSKPLFIHFNGRCKDFIGNT